MFNLFNFWIPLILVIQIFYCLPSQKGRNLWLLIASWGFYIFIDWRVFPCLLTSTVTDYIAGFLVVPKKKKLLRSTALFISLFINIGLLFIFKYIPNLLIADDSFVSLLKSIGLPLGISFYTFQTISYTIDCYRGRIKPTSDFLSFALYVSFFPQIAAGPIEKAKNLLPQFQTSIQVSTKQLKEAFYLILLGLFKKIYVAGALIHPLKRIYESNEAPASLALLTGLLAICHVYTDFSAYSDLARGIAKFFGIELMVNFKPFIFSKNPKEYWMKWHISLYKWIQDYLMKPVVHILKLRNKKYLISLYIFILFIAIAFWHKVSLNWLLFGIFNSFTYTVYRFCSRTKFWKTFPNFPKYLVTIIFMFCFHTINGLLYYSESFESLIEISSRIIHFNGFGRETFDLLFYLIPFLFPLFMYEWFQNKKGTALFIMKTPFLMRGFWIAFVIVCVFIFERSTEHSFIYFGF